MGTFRLASSRATAKQGDVRARCGSGSQLLMKKKNRQNVFSVLRYCLCFTGPYRCTFTTSNQIFTLKYKAMKTITVSSLYVNPNLNNFDVTCNSPEMQTNSPLLTCCIDRHLPLFRADWKVNGAINITGKVAKRLSFACSVSEFLKDLVLTGYSRGQVLG